MQVNVSCPCSIWGSGVTPPVPDSGDSHAVVLGVKFTAAVRGTVTGVPVLQVRRQHGYPRRCSVERDRRAAGLGHLHQRDCLRLGAGQLLRTRRSPRRHHLRRVLLRSRGSLCGLAVVFLRSTCDGRQRAFQPAPESVARRNGPPGGAGFSSANGVYSYSTNTFPTKSFAGTNYWVDPGPYRAPLTPPGQATNVSAQAGMDSASVSWDAPTRRGSSHGLHGHAVCRR